jgi:hypothetical protein
MENPKTANQDYGAPPLGRANHRIQSLYSALSMTNLPSFVRVGSSGRIVCMCIRGQKH